ncbi:MAG: flavin reductase, partial [Lachnospiraceae bacterium]|nr:flavin reductase [Candidatus Equihabitans merdae]
VSLECKVTQALDLGVHTMFVAEVLAVHVDDTLMNETGRFCFNDSKPLVYSHGEYYGIGKKIGKFGYSVKKTRKKKK